MIKKMRVLFISRCFPPATGGMERFAKDLQQSLKTKTDQKVLSWGGSKKELIFVLPYFFVRSLWQLAFKKVDIIHAQDGVVSIVLTPLAGLFRKPLIVVMHGLDVTFKNNLYQRLIRWSLVNADTVICISGAAKEEVVKRGILASKVKVIPLGITDELFIGNKSSARKQVQAFVPAIQNETTIILSSGRLVQRKGVDWFVDNVMPGVVRECPEAVLLVSGEGEWRLAIQTAIDRQKLSKNVVLLGRTTDTQLKSLYNAADCFVMPNVTVAGDMEGFGRVLLEAALCETPVVASGIEGIVDAIHDGNNGILVGEKDAAAFTNEIIQILHDGKKSIERGKKARMYTLKNYGWPTIADRYVNEYVALTNRDAK
jgi:glycosyltransferase involved in cell wall biosynthesis